MSERRRLHAVIYDDPEQALAAVRTLRGAGFLIHDVHSPFPIHGMDKAMGLAGTRIPYATLAGAALGTGVALGFQLWTHARDWPLMIGGKDFIAWPALIPITFEVAVLLAAFATVGSLVVLARLWPRAGAPAQPHPGVTDDRFVVVVNEADASFSSDRFKSMTAASGCSQVIDGWRVE